MSDVSSGTPLGGSEMDRDVASILRPEGDSPEAAPSEDVETTEVETAEAPAETEEAATEEAEDTQDPGNADEKEETAEDKEEPAEASSEEGEEKPSEEAEQEEEEDTQAVVFTDSDGNEYTLEALKKGNLRQADYTTKTQELAQDRQTFVETLAQHQDNQEVLAQTLGFALDVVVPELTRLNGVDMEALLREDPHEFAIAQGELQIAQQKYQQIVEASQVVTAANQERQAAAKAEWLSGQAAELRLKLPDFADPNKAKAAHEGLKSYGESQGFTLQEMTSIGDHRMLVLLDKAKRFDELSAKGLTAAGKKVKRTPKKVLKSGAPVTKKEKSTQASADKRSRLKASGSDEDAMALLMQG